jgi:hypothetical protein
LDGASKSESSTNDDVPSEEPTERMFTPIELEQMRFEMANALKYVMLAYVKHMHNAIDISPCFLMPQFRHE